MNKCFYCANGNVHTPPGCKSFEEFVDSTTVSCKLGKKTGCDYCRDFKNPDGTLSQADKALLLSWGHPESDFAQIEQAMQKSKTTYKMDCKPISREKAIEVLGREAYLSGISRSAFHFTAARQTQDGKVVLFDSSKLFR